MDFYNVLMKDEVAIDYLMKIPETIKFVFKVAEDECPRKFLMRKTNSYVSIEPSRYGNGSVYSYFPLALSIRKDCASCSGALIIKKCVDAKLYDDIFGTVQIKILTKFCKTCKTTVYPGFSDNQLTQMRIYDDDWEKYDIFVSTHCTAFSTDFLRRFVALKQKCHVTFFGRADSYNYQHQYTNESSANSMDHRRLIEVYFKYILLSFKKRHELPMIINGNIFTDLEMQYKDMYHAFHNKYSSHTCDVTGCKTCIVIDGHMKATRKVCKFKTCQKDPILKCVYCSEHVNNLNHEVIDGQQQLNENEYHIERIVRKIFKNKQWKYEVKWQDYEELTLEHKENIPRVLIELFEIYGNSTIPTEIESYFEKGGIKYVSIKIKDEILQLPACAMEVNEQAYYTPSPDHVSCDTHKTKKRFYHRTGGVLVMGKPCGVITHIEEIFGAESITNVAEMIERALGDLGSETVNVLYDDACHLFRHAIKRPSVYPELSTRNMKVDKFHFKNHVDPWCKQNMDPYKCDALKEVNTEVMEQTFSWLKGYAPSLKYMRSSTFNFLILDLIDRHNIDIISRKN